MAVIREYLDPERKLVDEAVRWLVPRARSESSGAKSLSHVLVVVPTAQSARNLRFALAEAFAPDGVLPPRIEMSGVLLAD